MVSRLWRRGIASAGIAASPSIETGTLKRGGKCSDGACSQRFAHPTPAPQRRFPGPRYVSLLKQQPSSRFARWLFPGWILSRPQPCCPPVPVTLQGDVLEENQSNRVQSHHTPQPLGWEKPFPGVGGRSGDTGGICPSSPPRLPELPSRASLSPGCSRNPSIHLDFGAGGTAAILWAGLTP